MSTEEEQQIAIDENGRLELWLAPLNGQLVLGARTGKYVARGSASIYRSGIFQFRIRGSAYNESANRSVDTSAGTDLVLSREPDNEHDPNAIAIMSAQGRKLGYVNKLNAKRITKLLDAGEDLVAVSLRGSSARSLGDVIQVLVVQRDVLEHLRRDQGRPPGWTDLKPRPE